MKMKKLKLWLALGAALVVVAPAARAGELPPAGPADPSSARFTLGDIYSRLTTGAAGVKRVGAFTEPALGPATFTMNTTDQIMGAAPAADNTNGATAANVLAGKTFWGLRTSGGVWGLQTGTGTGTSYAAGVPKTGQKVCYDASNVLTTCPGSPAGQDGALQKGVAYPNPRFTDNGNGTVTDNLTSLIWLKNANCFGIRTWSQAMGDAAALASGACGLTDSTVAGAWRLPNVREQQSLVDYNYINPAVPNALGTGKWTAGDPFTSIQSNSYWTSSTLVGYPTVAWIVNLYVGGVYDGSKAHTYSVWPVRGGP